MFWNSCQVNARDCHWSLGNAHTCSCSSTTALTSTRSKTVDERAGQSIHGHCDIVFGQGSACALCDKSHLTVHNCPCLRIINCAQLVHPDPRYVQTPQRKTFCIRRENNLPCVGNEDTACPYTCLDASSDGVDLSCLYNLTMHI